MIYCFENCELDTTLFELRKEGEALSIEPKAFDLLRFLVENRDRLVSKDELLDAVWDGRIVSEATVGSCVNAARKAIGDSGKEQRFIQTLPRRGFRFVGAVDVKADPSDANAADKPAPTDPADGLSNREIGPGRRPEGTMDRPSIAVLPFDNLSDDTQQDYFADGLAEDIITALSQFRWFFVMARNSSFSYKGETRDFRRIAEELDVEYMVEGSVRKDADRVRVSVKLVDARTGRHLWADRYDRELSDIFRIQDEITQRIAATIAPTIERSEVQRIATAAPANLAAWEYCLKGNAFLYEMRDTSILEARRMFSLAIETDPGYSRAYSGLAFTYSIGLRFFGETDRTAGTERLIEAAKRAVELDVADSKAHVVMALAYMYALPPQPTFAVAAAREAIALNPDDPQANSVLGVALSLSAARFEEGISWIEKAVAINPRDPINHLYLSQLSLAYLCAGRIERSVEIAEEALRRKHGFIESHLALASALGHLNRAEDARNAIADFRDTAASFVNEHLVFAADVKEQVLAGLAKAGIKLRDTM